MSYIGELYEEGRPVPVVADSIAAGRDAQLHPGGRLTGTIKSASTGHPLEGVIACAFQGPEIEACAISSASGSYAITGTANR